MSPHALVNSCIKKPVNELECYWVCEKNQIKSEENHILLDHFQLWILQKPFHFLAQNQQTP